MNNDLDYLMAKFDAFEQQRLSVFGVILPETTYLDASLNVREHLARAIEANINYRRINAELQKKRDTYDTENPVQSRMADQTALQQELYRYRSVYNPIEFDTDRIHKD